MQTTCDNKATKRIGSLAQDKRGKMSIFFKGRYRSSFEMVSRTAALCILPGIGGAILCTQMVTARALSKELRIA